MGASRRCLDIVGRAAGGSNSLSRTWSATLVVQHRCYSAPAAAQKIKEKPAVHATASPSTSRKAGKADTPTRAAKEETESERTVESGLWRWTWWGHVQNSAANCCSGARVGKYEMHTLAALLCVSRDLAWHSHLTFALFSSHSKYDTRSLKSCFRPVESAYQRSRLCRYRLNDVLPLLPT